MPNQESQSTEGNNIKNENGRLFISHMVQAAEDDQGI